MPRVLVLLLAIAAALIAPAAASATPGTPATIAVAEQNVLAAQTRVDTLQAQITRLTGEIQLRETQIQIARAHMQALLASPLTAPAAGPFIAQFHALTAQNAAARAQLITLATALGNARADLAIAQARLAAELKDQPS